MAEVRQTGTYWDLEEQRSDSLGGGPNTGPITDSLKTEVRLDRDDCQQQRLAVRDTRITNSRDPTDKDLLGPQETEVRQPTWRSGTL